MQNEGAAFLNSLELRWDARFVGTSDPNEEKRHRQHLNPSVHPRLSLSSSLLVLTTMRNPLWLRCVTVIE